MGSGVGLVMGWDMILWEMFGVFFSDGFVESIQISKQGDWVLIDRCSLYCLGYQIIKYQIVQLKMRPN